MPRGEAAHCVVLLRAVEFELIIGREDAEPTIVSAPSTPRIGSLELIEHRVAYRINKLRVVPQASFLFKRGNRDLPARRIGRQGLAQVQELECSFTKVNERHARNFRSGA